MLAPIRLIDLLIHGSSHPFGQLCRNGPALAPVAELRLVFEIELIYSIGLLSDLTTPMAYSEILTILEGVSRSCQVRWQPSIRSSIDQDNF